MINPQQEGQRIAAEYLDMLGWVRSLRRVINDEIYPAADAEKREIRLRQADQKENDAETFLSAEFDRWRKDPSPEAKEVLKGVLALLGPRHDLGFIGNRVVGHIRRMLTTL